MATCATARNTGVTACSCVNQLIKKWINKKNPIRQRGTKSCRHRTGALGKVYVKRDLTDFWPYFRDLLGFSSKTRDDAGRTGQKSSENQVCDSETSCWWERSEEMARRTWADRSHSVRQWRTEERAGPHDTGTLDVHKQRTTLTGTWGYSGLTLTSHLV